MFLKNRFKKFAGPRFIKMDGTGWHSNGLQAVFQRATVRAGAAYLAAIALYATFSTETEILKTGFAVASTCFTVAASSYCVDTDKHIASPSDFILINDHAIDREGRAIPPMNNASLLVAVDVLRGVNARHMFEAFMASTAGTALYTAFAVAKNYPLSLLLVFGGIIVPGLTRMIALDRRCKKILADQYRFSGNPPPEKETVRFFAPTGAKITPV